MKFFKSGFFNCRIFSAYVVMSFTLGFLTFSDVKAQDHSNCGILVDGVLADSIPCWSFGNMSVIYPMNVSSWLKYDKIEGILYNYAYNYYTRAATKTFGNIVLKREDLNDYSDASYGVIHVFSTEKGNKGFFGTDKRFYAVDDYCTDCAKKEGILSTFRYVDMRKDPKDRSPYYMQFELKGYKITSYREDYVNGSVVKYPVYDNGAVLYSTNKIGYKMCFCPITTKDKKARTDDKLDCKECEIDPAKPCAVPGKKIKVTIEKVDYEGRYGKIRKEELRSAEINKDEKTDKKKK